MNTVKIKSVLLDFCLLLSLLGVYFLSNRSVGALSLLLLAQLLIIPGNILLRSIVKQRLPILVFIAMSVSLSILMLYFSGLVLSLTQLHLVQPLRFDFVFKFLFAFSSIVSLVSALLNKSVKTFSYGKILHIDDLKFFLLPIMSYLGAVLLNNGYSNTLIIVTYLLVLLVFVLNAFTSDSKDDDRIGWIILSTSLSLLLSASIRSNNISGYDISHEYKLFLNTLSTLHLNVLNIKSAYDACLSINLLPTVLVQTGSIAPQNVFKVLFVIIFSLIPVIQYHLSRIFFSKQLSFLGSAFFISQYWFVAQLPTVNRQGIAYLFYILFYYILFAFNNSSRSKGLILTIVGLGVILSHYTTAYIFLGTLVSVKIMMHVFKFIKVGVLYTYARKKTRIPVQSTIDLTSRLPSLTVIALCAFAYFWFGIITKTLPKLEDKVNLSETGYTNEATIIKRLQSTFSYKFIPSEISNDNTQYIASETNKLAISRPYLQGIELANFEMYANDLVFTSAPQLPALNNVSINIRNAFIRLFIVSRIVLNNILLPLGIFLAIFITSKKTVSVEYVMISLNLIFLVILLPLVPNGLQSYNIERIYLQLLITGSCFIFYPIFQLFKNKTGAVIKILILALFCTYYLFYLGLAQLVVGGNMNITLFNEGAEYYKNFSHDSEVATSAWVSPYIKNAFVFSDLPGKNRLQAFGNADESKVISPILPTALNSDEYVFLNFHNEIKGLMIVSDGKIPVYVTVPKTALNKKKNLIFSTKETAIYR